MDAARNLNSIFDQADSFFSFTQSIRRDLHRHPEIGFQEFRTSQIVADELKRLGYEVTTGLAVTGVTGVITGEETGRAVLLRFDMDALPLQEENDVDYVSTRPGVMHACGHDGHVAVGLTVARLLAERREQLCGKVMLVFQPAEEGLGGAAGMVKAGVADDPRLKASLAMHLWNERPYGWAAIHEGPLMAGSDVFEITVHGKGGHGAMPQNTVDPVLAGAHIVTALQSVVSRNVAPHQSAVVSLTQFLAGDAFNVIPSTAVLRGTIRSFEPEVREMVISRFEEIVHATARSFGCRADIHYAMVSLAVSNDPVVSHVVEHTARKTVPTLQIDRTYRTTVSEDMSEFFTRVPGCYILVGSAPQKPEDVFSHHHPRFNFDERALVIGAALMVASAIRLLEETHQE